MTRIASTITFVCLLTLAGCTSIPLTTMYKMRNMTPLEAQPEHIKVAVRADQNILIRKGNVELSFGYKAEDGSLIIEDLFLIEVEHNSQTYPQLLKGLEDGEAVTILALSRDDAMQMKQSQRLIRQQQKAGIKGQGSLGISLSHICKANDKRVNNQQADLFLQIDPFDDFLLFFDDMDINEGLGQSNLGELKVCD